MFGTYCVDKKNGKLLRLNLTYKTGEINFYICSIKYLEGDSNSFYDWSPYVMNETWNQKKKKQN